VLVDDRDAFTAAVRELLDNDGLRRRLGEAARTRALGFSWDATGAAWRDLIEHR
jgi:glycosyltransferase involved in cell wall biosynthesis